MKNIRLIAVWVGCSAMAIVLALNALGGFRWLEDWTIDLRFRYGRWEKEDPGDQLALVAIDDTSLDTIGRWPWKRQLLAEATREIARAGAKTIAFDILFTEPELDSTGDEELARAMAQTQCVVALALREEKLLDPVWDTPLGQAQLAALTTAVAAGMDRDIQVIVQEAGLVEPYKSRVLERPAALKGLAAWLSLERLRAMGTPPRTLDDFVAVMLGGAANARHVGDFGERKTIERMWSRGESWNAIAHSLLSDSNSKGTPQDLPPIPQIAKAAKAAGVVNADADKFDGKLRRVPFYFPTGYGIAAQFGLAAALAFQDRPISSATLSEDGLPNPDGRVSTTDGKVLVNWPTQLLAGYGNKGPRNATVSIGRLIEQSRARERMAQQEARLDELGLEIATGVLGQSPQWFREANKDGRLKKEIVDIWENDYEEHANDADLDPSLKKTVDGLREWILARRSYEEGSAKVLSGDLQLRETLGGKLVFVGFTATGVMADMINTIFGPRTPGVFGHIAVADMVLNHRVLLDAPRWVNPLAILALGLVSTVVASRFGAGIGTMVVLLVLSIYIGLLGILGFDRGELVFPMAAPVACGIGSWFSTTVAVAVITQLEKQRITRQFRARVSPQLVEMLSKDPNALTMGGVEREATILFGDLAGFTAISEELGGPAVVSTLNLYMRTLTRELTARRAYVNKFLGDGILAFWSAFAEEPEQGRLSIEAAVACQRVVNEIGESPQRQGLPKFSLRLGLATGRVIIGDCGAPPDLNDYTMIGDSGNVASRLESANKQFGTRILIDGRTAELGRGSDVSLLSLGRVVMVGQTVPIEVFEVCLERDPSGRIALTEAMVRLFSKREDGSCRASLDELERAYPSSSKLVAAFRGALDHALDPRDGVLRLRAK